MTGGLSGLCGASIIDRQWQPFIQRLIANMVVATQYVAVTRNLVGSIAHLSSVRFTHGSLKHIGHYH